MPINLSDAAIKISNGPRSCTNPFLSQTFSIPEYDNLFINNTNNSNSSQFSTTAADTTAESQIVVSSSMHPAIENFNPFSQQFHENNEIFFNFSNIHSNEQPLLSHNNKTDDRIENAFSVTNVDTKKLSQSNNLQDNDNDNKLPENVLAQNELIMSKQNCIEATNCSGNNVPIVGTFRNRSLSETTEVIENELLHLNATGNESIMYKNSNNSSNTNPFRSNLHKTLSETYLEQYLLNSKHRYSASQMWMFSKSLSRQSSNVSLTKSLGSQSSIMSSDNETTSVPDIKRAMSCDSVNSDSSVVLADLEQPVPSVTGMLCVGLQYDK